MATERKKFQIGFGGFEVIGCEEGGWIVMRSRRPYGDEEERNAFYSIPFIAAFTTFAEVLKWLGSRDRFNGHGEVAK
jgi:hypothetical protein